ncbi:MAG: hypothetical protein JWP11_2245 [Frankiales bacterium]|nr:hypothetical protein [Frankiales bacterium]
MSTPEDRLRDILQGEAENLVPAGDGLWRIQQRLAERRSLRSRLVPAIAIGGVIAVAAAAAITVSMTDRGSLQPTHRPPVVTSPQPSACTGGLCQEPLPSPSLPAAGVTTSAAGLPVWPFTNDTEAADWEDNPGSQAWASDPVTVTQHLLDDYLKLPGQATRRVAVLSDPDAAIVQVSAGGRTVSQVRLVQVGRDAKGPWSVTGATAVDLTVQDPVDRAEVTSPLEVYGRVTGVDQSVHVRLMSGSLLAEGFAAAGQERPWSQQLVWTATHWSVGAIVGSTFSGKGDLSAVTITAVRRSGSGAPGQPASGTAFVAIEGGNVVSVDALSGSTLRQISYPPAGATDSSPDGGGSDEVVWVRTDSDNCTSQIILATLSPGAAGTAVLPKPVRRMLASLSAGGRSLGWVELPCTGGPAGTLEVRGPDGKLSTTAATAEPITQLDVRDDGWAVVQVGDKVVVLPSGVRNVSAGKTLAGDPGCLLAAPAWDGTTVVAWEKCGQTWQLSRWPVTGPRTHVPTPTGLADVTHTAIEDGQLLIWLADFRIARVTTAGLAYVPNAARWSEPDW